MPLWISEISAAHRSHIRLWKLINTNFVRRSYASVPSAQPRLHRDILDVLHRSRTVLPEFLPQPQASAWTDLVGTACDTLTGVRTRRPKIAVWGTDDFAQPTDLVSALLDDPLTSDRRTVEALRNRKKTGNDVFAIKYGEFDISDATATLNLSWLRNNDVDVIEIPSTHPNYEYILYDADIQLIILNPFASILPRGLESLLRDSTSFLIIIYPASDQRIVDLTRSRLTSLFPGLSDALENRIFQVYPPRAISALDHFREASNSAAKIQAFQINFLESGITVLSRSISQILSSDRKGLELCHAQRVLSGALEACRNSLKDTSQDISAVKAYNDKLGVLIDQALVTGVDDVLGGSGMAYVTGALSGSTQQMRRTMDALQWWKLPLKVDDLGDMLSHSVERAWCRDLDAKLRFQTGRLDGLRSSLVKETHATLKLLPSSFHSAVLVNTLQQVSSRPPNLSPDTLTHPVIYRLQQLQYPIIRLHRRAHRAVVAAFMSTILSGGCTYVAWLYEWVTPTSAVGLGSFGMMLCLRWLVGDWEKGKKRWWEDWHRVGNGLGEDLKQLLAKVMRERITAVPLTASKELAKAVALRSNEVAEMKAELERLENNSCHGQSKQGPSTT